MGANVSTIINSFGLMLDIVGAVMIFVYGLPSKWQEGSGRALEETPEEEMIRDAGNMRLKGRAKIGLGLLIAGFAFQLVSNIVP